jgi:hypothetical protein
MRTRGDDLCLNRKVVLAAMIALSTSIFLIGGSVLAPAIAATLNGTNGNDKLYGTDSADAIKGYWRE